MNNVVKFPSPDPFVEGNTMAQIERGIRSNGGLCTDGVIDDPKFVGWALIPSGNSKVAHFVRPYCRSLYAEHQTELHIITECDRVLSRPKDAPFVLFSPGNWPRCKLCERRQRKRAR